MTFTLRNIVLGVLAAVLGSLAVYEFSYPTFGKIVTSESANKDTYRYYQFFASTTAQTNFATTTSAVSTSITQWFDDSGQLVDGKFDIRGAKKVTFFFSRDAGAGGNNGLSVFKVQATADGSTWYDLSRLLGSDVSETATSTVTINAATTTVVVGVDLDNSAFSAVRCVVTETTDGSHSCAASATY